MLFYYTHIYDALEFRGAGHIRVQREWTVAQIDGPTLARWAGQTVTIVALDWRDDGMTQLAVLESGARVPLGEIAMSEHNEQSALFEFAAWA